MVAFFGGSAGSNKIETLFVLRLPGGIFGASPLVNSGGTIADMFVPAQRGLAMIPYGAAPFMGPTSGPILGGFISENVGWRWVHGICGIAIGVTGSLGVIFVPETYGPVRGMYLHGHHLRHRLHVPGRYAHRLRPEQGLE
jgi:MFS family permease